jgi:hypothetical protein
MAANVEGKASNVSCAKLSALFKHDRWWGSILLRIASSSIKRDKQR